MSFSRLFIILALCALITHPLFSVDVLPPDSIHNGLNYEELSLLNLRPVALNDEVLLKRLMYTNIKYFYPDIFLSLQSGDVFTVREAQNKIVKILLEKISTVNRDKIYSSPTDFVLRADKYDFEKECFQDAELNLCVGTNLVVKNGKPIGQDSGSGECVEYSFIRFFVFTPQTLKLYIDNNIEPNKMTFQVSCPKDMAKILLKGRKDVTLPAEIKFKPIHFEDYPNFRGVDAGHCGYSHWVECMILSYKVFTDDTRSVELLKGDF